MSRPYVLSPEARKQRSEAAKARWNALDANERTEALRPAFSITPGGPGRGRKKRPHKTRDAKTGKFVKASV